MLKLRTRNEGRKHTLSFTVRPVFSGPIFFWSFCFPRSEGSRSSKRPPRPQHLPGTGPTATWPWTHWSHAAVTSIEKKWVLQPQRKQNDTKFHVAQCFLSGAWDWIFVLTLRTFPLRSWIWDQAENWPQSRKKSTSNPLNQEYWEHTVRQVLTNLGGWHPISLLCSVTSPGPSWLWTRSVWP